MTRPRREPALTSGHLHPDVDCTLIVVAYNSAVDLPQLLESVAIATQRLEVRTIVVDNASSDDTARTVRDSGSCTLIRAETNLGYSGGINRALSQLAGASPILVLNADLVLEPDSIANMLEVLAAEHVGAVVPLLLDSEGRPTPCLRREPSLSRALGEALFGDRWASRPSWAQEVVREPEAYRHRHEVHWATGAAVLLSARAVSEIGSWDEETFFLYSEETDYFRRLRNHGYAVVFEPSAVVRHRGGGSGVSPALHALMAVNQVRYFRKYHRGVALVAFRAVSVLRATLRAHRMEERLALRAISSRAQREALPGGRRPRGDGGLGPPG